MNAYLFSRISVRKSYQASLHPGSETVGQALPGGEEVAAGGLG